MINRVFFDCAKSCISMAQGGKNLGGMALAGHRGTPGLGGS